MQSKLQSLGVYGNLRRDELLEKAQCSGNSPDCHRRTRLLRSKYSRVRLLGIRGALDARAPWRTGRLWCLGFHVRADRGRQPEPAHDGHDDLDEILRFVCGSLLIVRNWLDRGLV